MGLFDVHAHLTDPRLAAREAEVLADAAAAGVTSIVCNGLNPADNAAVAALAARSPLVRPAFGLYPVDAVLFEMDAMGVDYPREAPGEPAEGAIAWLEDHVEDCFAVGEIGLDHYWVPEALWARQEEVFIRLVKLAMAADKAIIIHSRKAEARAFELLVELGATRVDWHCFSGKLKLAQRIAAHGHYLSVPANAVRDESFRRMLAQLPPAQLLLETDCPYLGPVPGELNHPANVVGTAALAGVLWGGGVAAAQARLEENYAALFGEAP